MDHHPIGLAADHLVLGVLAGMAHHPQEVQAFPMVADMVEVDTEVTSSARAQDTRIGTRSGPGIDRGQRPWTNKVISMFGTKATTFDEWYSMMFLMVRCIAVPFALLSCSVCTSCSRVCLVCTGRL